MIFIDKIKVYNDNYKSLNNFNGYYQDIILNDKDEIINIYEGHNIPLRGYSLLLSYFIQSDKIKSDGNGDLPEMNDIRGITHWQVGEYGYQTQNISNDLEQMFSTISGNKAFKKEVDIYFQKKDNQGNWNTTNNLSESIMVQQVFNTTEQNFTWREFQIVSVKDGKLLNSDDTIQSMNDGFLLDYKIHNPIYKTSDQKVVRTIIFSMSFAN